MYDLVIKNAKICDGTGQPFFYADIAIRDGKIARISRQSESGRKTIDAGGLTAAPGFIDPHGHMDGELFEEPSQRAKLEQGICTNIGGLCGISSAPAKRPDGTVYGFEEYFKDLEQVTTGANLALFAGHGAIRRAVMGMSMEPADAGQLDEMKELVRQALEAGAVGLSFGLAYPPGSYATKEELTALCSVVAEYGKTAAFHIRDEADYFEDAVAEVIDIGRRTGVQVILSHHKAMREKNWGKPVKTLKMVDDAVREGINIYLDAHPYSTISAGLSMYLPPKYHALGQEGLTALSGEAAGREELIKDIEASLLEPSSHYHSSDPPKAYVLSSQSHPEYNGRRVYDIAAEQGKTFAQALVDLLHEDHMGTAGMHVDIMCREDIETILRHGRVMLCTDGASIIPGIASNPRVRGSFPRFIGRMVLRNGLLPLEQAVAKITYLPARVYGFASKGLIREGYDADIVLFDEKEFFDHATVEDYAALNTGLSYVLLDGKVVVKENEMTDKTCGKIIRL
jgi:N-acyl-D-aspartate/D-glutamate deacylase